MNQSINKEASVVDFKLLIINYENYLLSIMRY